MATKKTKTLAGGVKQGASKSNIAAGKRRQAIIDRNKMLGVTQNASQANVESAQRRQQAGTTPKFGTSNVAESGTDIAQPRSGGSRPEGQVTRGPDGNLVPYDAANPPAGDVASYEEIGAANIQDEYNQNLDTEFELTGEKKGYTSLEEYTKDQYKALKEAKELKEAQLLEQRAANEAAVLGQKRSLESNLDTSLGNLSGSREGFSSGSNVEAGNRLKTLTNERMTRIHESQDMARMEEEQARRNLARAEREGRTDLAAQYRQELLAATSKAKQIDTEYYNALTQQQQQTRANLDAGLSIINQGLELDTNALLKLSEDLGLDPIIVNSYYEGAQVIRDDKTLENDEKEAKLKELKIDLQRKIDGKDSEIAQAIDYLDKRVREGASPDEINMIKELMGVTNYADPITREKLAQEKAETAKKEYDSIKAANSALPGGTLATGNRRVDANNNPTAFTTDVAKNMGLIEGVDYVQGDKFPGDSNLYTAKLLGDPIEITIRGIDKAGFTTSGGKTRWSYTSKIPGANNKEWPTLTYDEKVAVISQMNKMEGGNGILVKKETKTTKSGDTKKTTTVVEEEDDEEPLF